MSGSRFARAPGYVKQVLGVRHRSRPRWFVHLHVLELAAKTEIRKDSPLVEWLYPLFDFHRNTIRHAPQPIPVARGFIGEQDQKKYRRLPGRVVPEGMKNAHDLRTERSFNFRNGGFELVLLHKRSRTDHTRLSHRAAVPYPYESFSISRAALKPGAPITPPPGCAPEPHRYSPLTGVRYRAQPATGRMTNI